MQHQEKYTSTWHSYSDHLREALGEMMTSSEFADVPLVTDICLKRDSKLITEIFLQNSNIQRIG